MILQSSASQATTGTTMWKKYFLKPFKCQNQALKIALLPTNYQYDSNIKGQKQQES